MSNMVFCWPNEDREASTIITSNSTVTDLPPSNLLTNQPSNPFRYDDHSSNGYIKIDLGATMTVKFIGLFGCTNVGFTATMTAKGDNTEAGVDGGSPDYTFVSAQNFYKELSFTKSLKYYDRMANWTYWNSTGHTSVRWIRLELTDTVAPTVPIDIGRLIVGVVGINGYADNFFEPGINMDYGYETKYIDNSEKSFSLGHNTHTVDRVAQQIKESRIHFNNLTEAEAYGGISELEYYAGKAKPIAFVADPAKTDVNFVQRNTVYGTLEGPNSIKHPLYEKYTQRYTLREMI